MGQLMNMAVGSLGPVAVPDLPWATAADVAETDDAYMVRVELPGVQRDQIDLQLQDRELVISGEIPEPQQDEKERRHRSSRRTGRFEYRTFLPGDVNPDGIASLSPLRVTIRVRWPRSMTGSHVTPGADQHHQQLERANQRQCGPGADQRADRAVPHEVCQVGADLPTMPAPRLQAASRGTGWSRRHGGPGDLGRVNVGIRLQ